MAFQRPSNGGGNKPALSVKLSVKQGTGYIQGPSFGFWPNDKGGPAFRGNLKDALLAEVLEFLSNAHEAGLAVSLAMFDNANQPAPRADGRPSFKPSSKPAMQRKPNPFKPQQQEEDQQESNPF